MGTLVREAATYLRHSVDTPCLFRSTAVLVSKQASVEGSGFTHCLDTCSVYCIVQNDIFGSNVFDDVDLAWVLANAAHGKAQASVERAVCDVDVGRVLLHADRVVSIVNDPAQEGDVVGIDCL